MALIDNKDKTMLEALTNALETADEVDICVGYFYFSGFQALADKLKSKKVRILVGKEIDPECIPEIVKYSRIKDEHLDRWSPRRPTTSALQLKQNYIDALIGLVNDSETFDSESSTQIFEMFVAKILDGTLIIRKTKEDFHGKFYLLKNSEKSNQGGDYPGTLFSGSSNLTYKGLSGQGELNSSSREKNIFLEHQAKFEELWDSSQSILIVDQSTATEFVDTLKEKLWIYQTPSPYELYIRVLHEIYMKLEDDSRILTPGKITSGEYMDFEYQTDAVIMALDRLEKFDGVIIADVVGLGKSIIASTIARNIDINTVIISPPHLIPQWEDYKEIFGIKGSKVYSAGNIKSVYERYSDSKQPLLLLIDEAHRFRNEDTDDYRLLHQICRSNPENKVILLTATPFNNSPKDIFALMKLFQTPGQSTIRSVDNLSIRFRELIQKYRKLRTDLRKSTTKEIETQMLEISEEQRRFLEPIVIRRSRLDLEFISRYREDLKRQNIQFAKIKGPELLEYDLGNLASLYLETLNQIGNPESKDGFIGARYKPATYIVSKDEFLERFGEDVAGLDLRVAQTNLSDFMRKLLVMRFESSKMAFKSTLEKMIQNNFLIVKWWDELGLVPIMKKGNLPDPSEFDLEDGLPDNDLESKLDFLRKNKGLLEIPIDWIDSQFIDDVKHDISILSKIHDSWFGSEPHSEEDPKLDKLVETIIKLQAENRDRKIVVFSVYADTVNSVAESLVKSGLTGVLRFTASDTNKDSRKVLLSNFDASYSLGPKVNDFQILVCTDALSEGVNLHRAGVVINYDIPYNPTRVIQRIGRINRINLKVFDELLIFNFFPTVVGELETRLKAISTLKIGLINNIVGTDTRSLTLDEDVQTFFKDEFNRTEGSQDQLSWDSVYIEDYETAVKDSNVMSLVTKIPRRTRIGRPKMGESRGVVFSKRGSQTIFITASADEPSEIIMADKGLEYFKADKNSESVEISPKFPELFAFAKEKLYEKHPMPEIRGRRKDALKLIEAIRTAAPSGESYCTDLARIISKYDDVSDGTLKDIAQIREKDPEVALKKIQEYVPDSFVRNILNRIQRMDEDQDVILLAEEFLK